MYRYAIIAMAALVPVVITVFHLYDNWRSADLLAHFASGVAIGGVLTYLTGAVGVLVITTILALAWEWVEPRLQAHFGRMTVGYHDTAADVMAVILGAVAFLLVP